MEKIYNYLLKVEYDGTDYSGWQYQKNGNSIQEKIENVLYKILQRKIRIIGAGRTDKGVHAFGQHANFKINKKIQNKGKLLNSLNFFLRQNFISIIYIKKKNLIFHSRHNAKERIYEYNIINREGTLSLYNNKAWHVKTKLDINLLKGSQNIRGHTRLLH